MEFWELIHKKDSAVRARDLSRGKRVSAQERRFAGRVVRGAEGPFREKGLFARERSANTFYLCNLHRFFIGEGRQN